MKLDDIIAVSGMSGLYRMIANRNNGLIIEELGAGKRHFVSARKHQFTPLASISIYTDDGDAVELATVFHNMLEQLDDNASQSQPQIPPCFLTISRMYYPPMTRKEYIPGDVKKVIKWFTTLKENGVFDSSEEEEE
ncbi:MAG: DUF5606 domain-containing protein [Saprospiraceae bacterium]